jgi:NADPH:quinone reductase-like Zn-dependent oxidoreductase
MHPATPAFTSRRSVAIRVAAKVDSPEALDSALQLTEIDLPHDLPPGYAVVAIRSAGVNPSDVRAVLGGMPHAIWPRTPGRDYAGVVVEGPQQLLGREVWGSGGDLGIRRDGTHARYLVLPAANLPQKPAGITFAEAGGVGVPFITAYEGLREDPCAAATWCWCSARTARSAKPRSSSPPPQGRACLARSERRSPIAAPPWAK